MDVQTRRPIRVLFVNDHLGFPGGVTHGSTTYLYTLLPSFDLTKAQPMLCICRARHPSAERFEALGINPIFLSRSKWDPRVLTDIVRLIRQHDIDILHLNGKKSHLLGRLAALITGRKAIIHLHFTYTPRPAFLQRLLAPYTSAAFGVSEPLRRQAVEKFAIPEARAETLYNPMDFDAIRNHVPDARARVRQSLGLTLTSPVIMMFGRVTQNPNKGHAELLKAMPKVLAACNEAILLVVGDGPARQGLEDLARSLNISERVLFTGHRSDIPDLLAAVDIVAMPSMWEEPFGYSALEAISVGRPVVGFRVGGIPEIVRDGESGILVPKGDIDGLAEGLVSILKDPEKSHQMGEAGKRHSENFSTARHIERLEQIYAAIAPHRPQRDHAFAAQQSRS